MERFVAIWLKNDFRLHDHHALFEALQSCKKTNSQWIMFVHLTDNQMMKHTYENEYYLQTVVQFKKRMEKHEMPVHLLSGNEEDVLKRLKETLPSLTAIYTNTSEVGEDAKREKRVKEAAEKAGIVFHSLLDAHLHRAEDVKKSDGTFYKVYSSYYKAWAKLEKPPVYKINNEDLKAYSYWHLPIDEKTEKAVQHFIKKTKKQVYPIGEKKAVQSFRAFVKETLLRYSEVRDYPILNATSHMSPYLRVGAISPRSMYYVVKRVFDQTGSHEAESFLKELAWREFFHMIYYYYPQSEKEEIQEKYRSLQWSTNEEWLMRWKEGKTGYPFVDAGMRQLKKEGFMHNRVRMVVANFLTKDYGIDWRLGEQYFKDMLIDYDPAQNIGNWQWAASVGMDAVPYFRIFNPTTQGEKFDKEGQYIRTYVEELKNVDTKYIHTPHKMSEAEQVRVGCIIGEDYPYPTVDHKEQRQKAIAFFKGEQ